MSFSAWVTALSTVLVLSLPTPSVALVSITTCQNTIARALLLDPALAYNQTIFFQTPASAENGSLTMFGCQMYCTQGQPRIEPDCGNRLFQWLLPALFLAVSIAPPPVGWWYQVWANLRPIADPFDAVLSVCHLLSVCQRCHRDAGRLARQLERRMSNERKRAREANRDGSEVARFTARDISRLQISIALIPYTSQNIIPDQGSQESFSSLWALICSSSLSTPALVSLIRRTAGRLAEDRTRGLAQAWFTSVSCVVSLVFATVPAPGGSSTSGVMVAAALVLAPLVRDVLLAHAIGECGPLYRAGGVLTEFLDGCRCTNGDVEVKELADALVRAGSEEKIEKLAVTAGTLLYQPRRSLVDEREGIRTWRHSAAVTFLLADTLTSFAAAAGALAAPPSFLNERHFLMFGILGGWMLSAATTSLPMRYFSSRSVSCGRSFEHLGLLVAVKDILVAVAIPVLFSATTCGWLSSCKLWSNYYGPGVPRVPLNNSAAFAWNDRVLYPMLVCTCLILNVLAYLGLRWLVYRKAFTVLAWSERAIGEALRAGNAGEEDGQQVLKLETRTNTTSSAMCYIELGLDPFASRTRSSGLSWCASCFQVV